MDSRRRKRSTPWLLAGPLLGGLITHLVDLAALHQHTAGRELASELIYAAEVAPSRERRRKRSSRSVRLDDLSEARRNGRSRLRERSTDDFSDLPRQRVRSRARASLENSYPSFDNPTENTTDVSEESDDCIPMHEWQTTHHPMCNALHELDLYSNFRNANLEYIDSGGFNDLFHYVSHPLYHDAVVNADDDDNVTYAQQDRDAPIMELAIKILSFESKPHTPHNYRIVRQDAVIQERLTSSPYIFPIYGYCGFALVLPYVSGGTLSSHLRKWRKGEIVVSSVQRLRYAVDMARALRDLHDIDGDGVPSVTHGDLKEQQYLITSEGGLQLGDFNKGEFLWMHEGTGETCPYTLHRPHNDKVFRSPEEYAYRPQTAAGDVWALGSLMYYLLTGSRVWREIAETHTKKVRKFIIEGRKPKIDERILNSKDPVDKALKKAYDMACVYDMEERATAREVSDYLEGVWEKLGY